MTVRLIAVKCPECGATLNIEENRQQAFCTYCGTKVLVHNENEHIWRNIDAAGVAQAETERFVKAKQIEFAERKWQAAEKRRKNRVMFALILGAAGAVMMIAGFMAGKATGDPDSGLYMISMVGMLVLEAGAFVAMAGKNDDEAEDISFSGSARLPETAYNYERKDYRAVETVLRSAGFTNIRCVPLNDLTIGVLYKPGMVESLSINGNDNLNALKKYPLDARIVISYHSRARQ